MRAQTRRQTKRAETGWKQFDRPFKRNPRIDEDTERRPLRAKLKLFPDESDLSIGSESSLTNLWNENAGEEERNETAEEGGAR